MNYYYYKWWEIAVIDIEHVREDYTVFIVYAVRLVFLCLSRDVYTPARYVF